MLRHADSAHEAVRQADLSLRLLDWYVHTSDVVPWDFDDRGINDGIKHYRR